MRSKIFPLMLITFLLMIIFVPSPSMPHPLNAVANYTHEADAVEIGRGKKKHSSKYLIPMLVGALMVKSIIFPLAFKAMAVMTTISVLLSTMSLIISSIVGYLKAAVKTSPVIRVVHKRPFNSWAKDDEGFLNNYFTIDSESKEQPTSGNYLP